jgi:polyvinyl alcohol dehydrogenase (cytochrome)
VRWSYQASAEVRTGVVAGDAADAGRDAILFFGDLIGNVHAIDARSGALRWRVHVDDHPHATLTGTPTLHAGVLYVPVSSLELLSAADPRYECCTFRGAVVALDARTGRVRWRAHPIEAPAFVRTTRAGTRAFAPSGAPIWNSPTVDAARGLLYVGTGEGYTEPAGDASDAVVAFDLRSGARRWVYQALAGDAFNHGCFGADTANCPERPGPDYDIGASVIHMRLPGGAERLFAGQKSGWVHALDPAAGGRLLWKARVGRGGITGGVHFGMATDGQRLYVPIHDAAHELDLVQHDRPPRPGLFALDPATGRELWAAPTADTCRARPGCNPGISAAVTALPGVVFAGHSDGVLRAYDSATGSVTWLYDTTAPVRTVSGETSHGGSMGSGGVAVRDGWLVVNSGYTAPAMAGNLMLVFALPRQETRP